MLSWRSNYHVSMSSDPGPTKKQDIKASTSSPITGKAQADGWVSSRFSEIPCFKT